ncbi:MAG TPA: hypothetical protein VGX23_06205 [Actinocrinis sp.]|nr:hypothetical protein [Actinocrinis sp.]
MTAKHARPGRPSLVRVSGQTTGRRLAAGAIILAAGAAPLLTGTGAQADSASTAAIPAAADGAGALPVIGSLPLGLGSLDDPTVPSAPATPAAADAQTSWFSAPAAASPLGLSDLSDLTSLDGLDPQSLPFGSLLPSAQGSPSVDGSLPLVGPMPAIGEIRPFGSLTGASAQQGGPGRPLAREAPAPLGVSPFAAIAALNPLVPAFPVTPAGVGDLAQSSAGSLAASTSATLGSIGQEVPPGGVGALTSGFTPQADALTGAVLQQSTPMVAQLQERGVPTIGDLTNQVGDTALPMIGPIGHLTQALPLSTVLGTENPLADALSTATQL